MRKSDWVLVGAAVIFFATGAWFYPQLPAQIASHWNAAGQVDGYMSRGWGVFLVPIIFLFLAAIFSAIPRIDPRRENIAKFRRYYDWLVIAIAVFFYYIYLVTLLANLGYAFNIAQALLPPLAGLFYVIGMILPHTEVNFTIGIRTPWTISSPTVWRKTHIVGGWAFKVSGVLGLVGIFFPPTFGFCFLLIPIIASVVGLFIYSYVLYEQEREGK